MKKFKLFLLLTVFANLYSQQEQQAYTNALNAWTAGNTGLSHAILGMNLKTQFKLIPERQNSIQADINNAKAKLANLSGYINQLSSTQNYIKQYAPGIDSKIAALKSDISTLQSYLNQGLNANMQNLQDLMKRWGNHLITLNIIDPANVTIIKSLEGLKNKGKLAVNKFNAKVQKLVKLPA